MSAKAAGKSGHPLWGGSRRITPTRVMRNKNKDLFDSYDDARRHFDEVVVPQFGATRMDWGFGRWLWLEVTEDCMEAWRAMEEASILTQEGRRHLARAEKAVKGGAE